MKVFKIIILTFIVISLFSCAERLSPKRSDAEQQEVKQQVMKLLEQEYHQAFKLENFEYEYKTQYPNASGNRPYVIFGKFTFKVKAIDNSIITMDFAINDDKKESVNELIFSFKKNQLMIVYCVGLIDYYSTLNKNNESAKQPNTNDTRALCEKIGHPVDNNFVVKIYDKKHHTN